MEKQQKSKLKFLLLLPALVLPFLALGFYALGGGKGDGAGKAMVGTGINTQLPGAQLKGQKQAGKLALYEQAVRDSARLHPGLGGNALAAMGWDSGGHKRLQPAEINEAKITQRLAEINRQVNAPVGHAAAAPVSMWEPASSAELGRLAMLIKQKSQGEPVDPEMKQLNGMLEKIMDIQHPERVDAALKKEKKGEPDSLYKAFRAVIVKGGKVKTGTSVELRLLDTVRLKGIMIPKGQAVFGLCEIINQRLLLKIKNIRLGTSLLPVDLTVFDMDGMEGIRANDADTQDALRSGSDNAVQNLELMSIDQSLATQAAGAGVQAAKALFSKKVKRIKVKLKAGYPVLLRNNRPNEK